MVRLLLQTGARVDRVTCFGLTPLHTAVRINPNPDVVEALIEAGVPVNQATTEPFVATGEVPS